MAKIAVELERALAQRARDGSPGRTHARTLAQGEGWIVQDVICTSGPRDRPFEERHACVEIALVAAGSFQYRSTAGSELMTPGSLLLGNPGQRFECAHAHGTGDRCLSFHYSPEYFEALATDAGGRSARPEFCALRLPPLRGLSPLAARACAGLAGAGHVAWEELALQLAARAVRLAAGISCAAGDPPASAVARVSRSVRAIEADPEGELSLARLARVAGLSPYHFLRSFVRLTGVTPHQYVLRTRLRAAALRLLSEPAGAKVLDVALDSGFGDVSNFNRAFRTEFGVAPRAYRSGRGAPPGVATRL